MPNDLWQMDITHVPSFGKSSYVHVTIDTFSHFAVASALSGENSLMYATIFCIVLALWEHRNH